MNATNILNVTQRVLYSCKEGFVFHPDSTGLLECNAGKFEPSLPECERRKFEKNNKIIKYVLVFSFSKILVMVKLYKEQLKRFSINRS